MIAESIGTIQRIQATFDQLAAPTTNRADGAGTLAAADLFAQLVAALGQVESSAPSGSRTGDALVAEAEKFLGTPYVFGGTSEKGIDCSGLTQRAAAALGINLPRVVADQKKAGTEVASLSEATAGDLIVLNGGTHIVMYAGDGEVIHAPEPGQVVKREKVWFDDGDIVTIRRIVPETSAPAAAAGSYSLQAIIAAQSAILNRSVS